MVKKKIVSRSKSVAPRKSYWWCFCCGCGAAVLFVFIILYSSVRFFGGWQAMLVYFGIK